MKRVISLLILLTSFSLSGIAGSVTDEGEDNGIYWQLFGESQLSFDGGDNVLKDMSNFSSIDDRPWNRYIETIEDISFAGNVRSIGENAFNGCTQLNSLTISSHIESIGDNAFANCVSLATITSEAVQPPSVSDNSFANVNLSDISLTVPNGLEGLYKSAPYWGEMNINFNPDPYDQTNAYLSAIYVDGTLIDGFEPYLFTYEVQLPDGTTTTPNVTYQAHSVNATVTIQQADSPNGIATLTVLSADETETYVYTVSFRTNETGGNTGGDPSETIIDRGTLDGDITWTLYESGEFIISGSGSTPSYANYGTAPWYNHHSLIRSLIISEGITSIGKYSFYGCELLDNVVLPSSLSTVGSYAFNNCTGLTNIVCYAIQSPSVNASTSFKGVTIGNITLKVPSESIESYMSDQTWGQMMVQSIDGGTNTNPDTGVKYSVNWSVDGEIVQTDQIEKDGYISVLPNNPEDCYSTGNVYVGWTDTQISEAQSWAPSVLYTSTSEFPAITEDVTYYAVYAKEYGGATPETSEYTYSMDVQSSDWENSATNNTSYWLLEQGTSLVSPEIQLENIASIKVNMRTYGGTQYNKLTVSANGVTVAEIEATNGSKLTDYESPLTLQTSGYGKLTFTSNYGTSKGIGFTSVIIQMAQAAITRDNYTTTCTNSNPNPGGDEMSGTLENGQSWSLEDGRLSLTGAGNIAGFASADEVPWYNHRNEITYLFLGADFSSIGGFVFYELNNLTTISCPSSMMPTLEANTFNPSMISQITATVRANLLSQYQADPYWSQMTLETYPDSGGDDTPTIYAEGYTGEGDGLHWIIYNNGQMTFDGVGDIPDFESTSGQPWYDYRGEVTDINFNGQIETVGEYAFSQFYGLNTITLSSTTQYLNSYCFNSCTSLTRVTAPYPDVMPSAEVAFAGLDYTKITLEVPESVVDAYKSAMFWYEFNVVAIGGSSGGDSIVDGLVEGDIRWSFNSNTGLLSIYGFGAMPDYIASMAPWGDYVDAIQKVEVCYGITYVCNGAFANCLNITSVTTAASVDSIGENIFTGNNSPIQFYVQNMTPPGITENTFANVNGCVYAYCYESAFTAYDSNSLWNNGVCLGYVDDPQDPNLREYQLQMIYINNVALADYNPNLYNYDITLPAGSDAPLVTYKPGYTTQSITVEQASSPEGTAYIHVNGDATYSLYFIEDGGGSQQGDELVTFELDSTWRFIMLPTVFGLSGDDVTTTGEVEWATYSGMQRASGRSGWAKILSSPTANGGVAYIVRATNGSAILNVKVPEGAIAGGISMALTLNTYEASHPENANWNFIGNLYNAGYNIAGFAAMGISSPIAVWNGTGYSTYTPGIDAYILQPFEPFFIQVPDDGSVSELMFLPEYFEGGSGSGDSGNNEHSYKFTSKSWETISDNWISGKDGYGFSYSPDSTNGNGVQITTAYSGANATCPSSYNSIISVIVNYCTNVTKGVGAITIDVSGETITHEVNASEGTSLRDLVFDYSNSQPSGSPIITVNCKENSIYINKITIITSGM